MCYSAVMNTICNLIKQLWGACRCSWELLKYALARALLLPKPALAARLLAAESQLAVCKHRIDQKKDPRPRFTSGSRFLWVLISNSCRSGKTAFKAFGSQKGQTGLRPSRSCPGPTRRIPIPSDVFRKGEGIWSATNSRCPRSLACSIPRDHAPKSIKTVANARSRGMNIGGI